MNPEVALPTLPVVLRDTRVNDVIIIAEAAKAEKMLLDVVVAIPAAFPQRSPAQLEEGKPRQNSRVCMVTLMALTAFFSKGSAPLSIKKSTVSKNPA